MQGQYVLVHEKTLNQFPIATVQHVIVLDNILSPLSDIEVMSDLPVSREYDAAFIIFTSGTTGPPKAVVHTHKSCSASIAALSGWDVGVYTARDHVLQVATCSWIIHIGEISLPLAVGGTLVLLRQGGLFDVAYFSQTLMHQQITILTISPVIIRALTNYIENSQQTKTFDTVRYLCTIGEAMKPQQWTQFVNLLGSSNVQICVLYGTSESGMVLGCHLLNIKDPNIPIGYPFPTIQCLLIDDDGKIINPKDNSNKIGQIHIEGPTLFNSYLNNPELTTSRFTSINNQVYIKTGDLARYNAQGKLFYVERADFQIKIRGQRVETTDIENTIANSYPGKISDCVVTKLAQNDDLLVAYVVSKDSELDTEQIRNYCNKHLQQYMVPSIFVFLKQLPLNANGKIDRQRLPVPDIVVLSTNVIDRQYIEPNNELEMLVHSVWCKILGCNRISMVTNFFSIGGHSLLFIEIYQYYQTLFNFDNETINTRPFFEHNTIAEHAKLLEDIKIDNIQAKQWQTLHINQCIASYAQQRIYLDEKMRFFGKVAIYNELTALQITKGSISMTRLLQALRCVLSIHKILRTSLVFNDDDSTLKQSVTDKHLTFTLAADQTFKSETELHNIISQINTNSNLFDLSSGRVFYCEILRQQKTLHENNDKEIITNSDVLVIGFHHAAIDQSSGSIFLNDLCNIYNSNTKWLGVEQSLQYIDYSVHERLIDMTLSREFWRSQLNGYDQECRLSLPVDRHCLYSDQRSGHASIAHISFDNDISTSCINYASLHQVTPFQLCLATFYAFLFKLTCRQNDLCISCLNANRYRTELQNMIGMFVSTLPYRIRVDSDWSFDELVEHVREKCLSILQHSHYPLQQILTDSQFKQSNAPFLETVFNFITISENSQWSIDTATLQQLPMQQSYGAAKFDFMLTCLYNPTSDDSKLSFCLTCSRDLFNETTVITVSERLNHLVDQLFSSKSISDEINPNFASISKLSLILPTEAQEIEDTVFCRQPNIINEVVVLVILYSGFSIEAPASYAQTRIWLDERIRFDPDKPQIAIYNMPFVYRLQSDHTLSIKQLRHALDLTINKHFSLHTSLHFDIEKNLLMQRVITHENKNNMFSIIETTYETDEQLNEILHDEKQQTQSRLVLVHHLTKTKFDHDIVALGIDSIVIINDTDRKDLSNPVMKCEGVAYIIFTSGSTGTPKAVQVRHKNFIDCIHSFVYMNLFNRGDTVVQIARCSFDIHVQEILGILLVGGGLIMLHPGGTINFNYLAEVFQKKQVTYITAVPSLLHIFFTSILQNKNMNVVKNLRTLCGGGEAFSVHLLGLIMKIGITNCTVWNVYGPAEATIDCTVHCINVTSTVQSIPIGRLLSNYRCMIMNQYLQSTVTGRGGELVVGGAGVFAGYFGRDDLTAKALLEIDGELFYRTGDLVKMDNNGLLHYQGRKDYQIKLRGQRIELGEIERCLLNITSISACVVIKWSDAHLVAYVQSSDVNEQELREHCQSHLPPHMIPSFFTILDKLPLNANGKVDRKQLPSPDFSLSTFLSSDKSDTPLNQFEEHIHDIWLQILPSSLTRISTTVNFFTIGGHSLLFIELYYRYQPLFNFGADSLSIALFLQQPTIRQHAQLLQTLSFNDTHTIRWQPLHINQGKTSLHEEASVKYINPLISLVDITSSAQKNIFLDEQVQISHETATYSNFFEHPFVVINENCDNILFVLPPGDGGAESYFNNIVPHLSQYKLVIFNNYYLDLQAKNMEKGFSFEVLAPVYTKYIKEIQHDGPYNFLGWSFGGVLSFELSRQLINAGEKVGNIFMIDSFFNVRKASFEIGKADKVDIIGSINYSYLPMIDNELFGLNITNRNTNIVLFKASRMDENFPLNDQLEFFSYYTNTSFNNLDTVVNYKHIQLFQMYGDSHSSWLFNEKQILNMCNYVANLLK
ncbi:unnamed protein product [Adineta steineri]|uniref:oleoyl-[acyl-carrier-protein] hydrolase n=1 Tax=Adineta steineri TaxID=433720 RepID=A0A814IYM2_9BILA|nr:unnamed protein product [Adineta steineri]CAF1034229.1 unnamed protein product [Adineta steineri]